MSAVYWLFIRLLAWITGTSSAVGLCRLQEIVVISFAVLFSWVVLAAVCYLFSCAVKHGKQLEKY